MDKELCRTAVGIDGYALKYVPLHLMDKKTCRIAIMDYLPSLQYVPKSMKNMY